MPSTWRHELDEARDAARDTTPVVAVAPDETVLDVEFDDESGLAAGPAVLIWTEALVYFPVTHDGSEWLESAPRDPVANGQRHVGDQ